MKCMVTYESSGNRLARIPALTGRGYNHSGNARVYPHADAWRLRGDIGRLNASALRTTRWNRLRHNRLKHFCPCWRGCERGMDQSYMRVGLREVAPHARLRGVVVF